MSIEQRLEQIEHIQQEILRLLRPDTVQIVAPVRDSDRRQAALSRAGHYKGLRQKRAASNGSNAAPVEPLTPLLGLDR